MLKINIHTTGAKISETSCMIFSELQMSDLFQFKPFWYNKVVPKLQLATVNLQNLQQGGRVDKIAVRIIAFSKRAD